jgi:xanthine dehydrogenase YagS FAD-binding subunit
MQPFAYVRVRNFSDAAVLFGDASGPPTSATTQFLAGGTTILDLMKLEAMQPSTLIDISSVEGLDRVEHTVEGLRLGALSRMADVARDPEVQKQYPVIAESLALAASPQLRNMATLAGNSLQRTRCTYFRDVTWGACNKRKPGSGCAALEGFNRTHAILGASEACIATYPGDLAQALIALDATVETTIGGKTRRFPFADLHRLPMDAPHVETNLRPGEMITGFVVPRTDWTARSRYLKIRDRESYEFALASAAVALDMPNRGPIRQARIALGGVATVPWRAREAEALLADQTMSLELAERAAHAAFAAARPREHNAFKVALGQQTLVRALLETANMEV